MPRGKLATARRLLDYLHDKLVLCNRYVQDFKTAYELSEQVEAEQGFFHIPADGVAQRPMGEHERRYNLAEGLRELQILIPDNEGNKPPPRDIVLRPKGGNNLQPVEESHKAYDALHYPLFFPEGSEDGWNLNMYLNANWEEIQSELQDLGEDFTTSQRYREFYNDIRAAHLDRGRGRTRLTPRDFYAFHLQRRSGERDTILRGCRAFQEYLVMAYAKVRIAICLTNSYLSFSSTFFGPCRSKAKGSSTFEVIKQIFVRSNMTSFKRGQIMLRRVVG